MSIREATLINCIFYQERAAEHAREARWALKELGRSARARRLVINFQECARLNAENARIRLSRLIGVE